MPKLQPSISARDLHANGMHMLGEPRYLLQNPAGVCRYNKATEKSCLYDTIHFGQNVLVLPAGLTDKWAILMSRNSAEQEARRGDEEEEGEERDRIHEKSRRTRMEAGMEARMEAEMKTRMMATMRKLMRKTLIRRREV